MPNPKRKEKIIKCKDICPLCAGPASFVKNNFNLQDIVYKHLHITMKENDVIKICEKCERTVVFWDEFAQKCWSVQNLLTENSNNVKDEDDKIIIKLEPFNENYSNDSIDGNDDNGSSIHEYDLKIENSLEVKLENLSQNEDTTKSKLGGKKKKKDKTENKPPSCIEYICHICSLKLTTWSSLSRHCTNEHSAKARVLCICGKYLFSRSPIKNHRAAHEKKNFRCEECNKDFLQLQSLKYHKLAAHTPPEQHPFSCDQCSKRFCNAQLLQKHTLKHFPPDRLDKFACELCDSVFTNKPALKRHLIIHHENSKNYICDVCGAAFFFKGNLKLHKVKHSDSKDFKCDQCVKRYKTDRELKRHLKSHSGRIGFKCPECPTVLCSRQSLKEHQIVHSDILGFSCTLCDKRFKRKQNLKNHIETHSGLKPSICQYCSQAFANNRNLSLHQQRLHTKEYNESILKANVEMSDSLPLQSEFQLLTKFTDYPPD